MRGQATIEYLLLLSVGLGMIAVSMGALSSVRDTADTLSWRRIAEVSASALHSHGEEVCALGDGNSREIKFGWAISIECGEGKATAYSRNESSAFSLHHCDISCANEEGSSFIIKNSGGEVEITKG